MARPRPVLLLILDGWGHRDDNAHNAIAEANAPNWRRLLATYPHTLVETHGEYVGLPDGQMGNSEVGHMNIGLGRIVYQDLTRIDAAIRDGTFFGNAALVGACEAAKASGGTLHVMGLMSPGGVHSHEDHIFAMLDLAARRGVSRIAVHAFLDGRDTPPRSARATLERFEAKCASNESASGYLEITVRGNPSDPRVDDISGDLSADWGLHLVDVNIAMGSLVALAETEYAAFAARP